MRQTARIHDHALIGDGRAAALVSRDGAIDWLCWPRFDSPSLFASLLDPDHGGAWRISPSGASGIARRYLGHTNVLCTRYRTPDGILTLTDWLPAVGEDERRTVLLPEHEILRMAVCEEGAVPVELDFRPRPDYGRSAIRLHRRGARTVCGTWASGLLALRCSHPLTLEPDRAAGRWVLTRGQKLECSLTWSRTGPAVLPPLGPRTLDILQRSRRWWERWIGRADYDGPYREAVLRSALVLKLLTYAPSGAVIAAPTTSLPERLGAGLNWDYRYCWLRDASFAVRAWLGLGFRDEAEAFVNWLLHATRLSQPRLDPLYDVFGRPPQAERTVPHLSGYRGSRPVRIGNAAQSQHQMDLYGELIDAAVQVLGRPRRLDRQTRSLLGGLGRYVCEHWRDRDAGIWEIRGEPQAHTHSMVLCWTALDRLAALGRDGLLPAGLVARFTQTADAIRQRVETEAWNPRLNSYVRTLGGTDVDASLLLLPWYGYIAPDAPRMRTTFARLRDQLGTPHGWFTRNADIVEGAFGACTAWGIEYVARGGGPVDDAERVLESLLACANDVGLLGEELDLATGEALGNFPMGFTHIGIINAALAIAGRRRAGPVSGEARAVSEEVLQ